jgi:hypothetical protein
MVVMFILLQMWQYRRPRKLVRKWMQYSGSALGLGVASGWLVSHSRLSGSNDLDRWFQEGVEASSSFLKEHIQQPVTSLLNCRLSLHCCFSKSQMFSIVRSSNSNFFLFFSCAQNHIHTQSSQYQSVEIHSLMIYIEVVVEVSPWILYTQIAMLDCTVSAFVHQG